MLKFSAKVIVTLKDDIKDIQGEVIDKTLKRLEIEDNSSFSVGKFYSFNITSTDFNSAQKKLEHILDEVLVNQIVEKYEILEFSEQK